MSGIRPADSLNRVQACKQGGKVGDRFFEEWRVYEKLVIHDYMDHRAFFTRLQGEIQARFHDPVAILDLGCGDMTPILPLLENVPVRRYLGIDESDAGLAIAARNLAHLDIPGQLIQGNLLAVLPEMPERFDVIVASFSLHHLENPADKLRVLTAGRERLDTDGLFALIDVFSGEDEARDHYIVRWINHADARYLELQTPEKEILFDHVRARDFPVSHAAYRALGKQAGLGRFDVLLEDSEKLNGLVIFSTPNPA